MPIEFHCVDCGRRMRVADGTQGKSCQCPGCSSVVKIPSKPSQETDLMAKNRAEEPQLQAVACPNCSQVLNYEPKLEGTRGMCRGCHHVFTISQTTSNQPSVSIEPEVFAFACSNCSHLFEGRKEMAGKKGKCTECEHVFVIEKYTQPVVASLKKPEARKDKLRSEAHQRNPPVRKAPPLKAPPKAPKASKVTSKPSANWTLDQVLSDIPPVSLGQSNLRSQSSNPYAVTSAYSAPNTSYLSRAMLGGSAEEIRRLHLSHEASIKSFGTLFLLGSAFLLAASVFVLVLAIWQIQNPDSMQSKGNVPMLISLVFVYLCFGLVQGYAAWGLIKLWVSGRILGTILGVFGLIGFPIGTLMSAYLLYLLWCPKGAVVFSPEYKSVIQLTPHIKYKTSIIVWIFVWILVFILILALIAFLLAPRR